MIKCSSSEVIVILMTIRPMATHQMTFGQMINRQMTFIQMTICRKNILCSHNQFRKLGHRFIVLFDCGFHASCQRRKCREISCHRRKKISIFNHGSCLTSGKAIFHVQEGRQVGKQMVCSVTRKKSPNVYKSCPKMISLEK